MSTKLPQIRYAETALRERCGLPVGHKLTSELLTKECFSYADIIAAFEAGEDEGSRHTLEIVHHEVDRIDKEFLKIK